MSEPAEAQIGPALVQRVLVRFTKGESVRFVGHLDLMRLIERGMRRCGFPVLYSQGFNPRPRMSLASALTVGATSGVELCQLDLAEPVPEDQVTLQLEQLDRQLPPGICLCEWWAIPLERRNPYIQVSAAQYRLDLERYGDQGNGSLLDAVQSFFLEGPGAPAGDHAEVRSTAATDPERVQVLLTIPVGGAKGMRIREITTSLEEVIAGAEVAALHRTRLCCELEPQIGAIGISTGEEPTRPA